MKNRAALIAFAGLLLLGCAPTASSSKASTAPKETPKAEGPKMATPTRTAATGGEGGEEFTDAPSDRPVLVGLRIWTTQHNGEITVIGAVQPLFQAPGSKTEGNVHGNSTSGKSEEAIAKPGYAIGAIVAKGGAYVDGFRVVFMKINGGHLVPDDVYESNWFGGRGGGEEETLSGQGAPIVGVHGRAGLYVDQIGLIYCK